MDTNNVSYTRYAFDHLVQLRFNCMHIVTVLDLEQKDVSWRNMRVSYIVVPVPLYRLGVVIAAAGYKFKDKVS